MKKRSLSLRDMLRRFVDFTKENQAKLDAIPIVKEIVTLILGYIPQFQAAWETKEVNNKGTTLTKKKKKNEVAILLSKVNQLIYNYCIKINDLKLIDNFKGSRSVYTCFGVDKLLSRLDFTIKYCENMGEKLSETGVSIEIFTSLKTLQEEYKALVPQPKELQSKAKIASNLLDILAKKITDIFSSRLNKVMQSMFEGVDEQLYEAYLEATHIEKVSRRKTAVTGHIRDKATKEPIKHAHIIIVEADIDHTCSGKLGGFRIKNLEADTYNVLIKAATYKDITLQLMHRYGETNVLEIEMETEGN